MLAARGTTARRLVSRRAFSAVADVGGVKVAAIDNGQSTSSITVLAKGGSRFESKAGVATALKNFAFKSTPERSFISTVRESELYGGVLSANLSREHLALTAEFLRGDEKYFASVLSSFISSARYTRHEFEEYVVPALADEALVLQSSPSTLALDLAHVLAFRAPGLGSSLFASGHKPLTHTDVANFAHSVFTAGNVAILGTGIGQSELQSLVEKYLVKGDSSLAQGAGPQTRAAKYYGGETWIDSHYDTPTLFIGFGASGAPSSALATLAEILTPAPSVKWASGTSPISAFVPAGATVEVIHLPYTDAALFGYLVTAKNSADIKVAAQAAVKALKDAAGSSGIKSEDLKKGIAKAKFTAASSIDTREGLVSVLGSKVLSGGEASAESLIKSLDSVSNAAVSKAASSLVSAKPTFVGIGDVSSLPHPDELGL